MPAFRTLDSVDVKGKRVLTRVDLNLPMKDGKVTDATRIDRVLPTIKELANKGAKVILLAHFGRPDGKKDPKQSLKPVAEAVASRRSSNAFASHWTAPGPRISRKTRHQSVNRLKPFVPRESARGISVNPLESFCPALRWSSS